MSIKLNLFLLYLNTSEQVCIVSRVILIQFVAAKFIQSVDGAMIIFPLLSILASTLLLCYGYRKRNFDKNFTASKIQVPMCSGKCITQN